MDNDKLYNTMAQLVMVKGVVDGLANNWPCDLKCDGCPAISVCKALFDLQLELKDALN